MCRTQESIIVFGIDVFLLFLFLLSSSGVALGWLFDRIDTDADVDAKEVHVSFLSRIVDRFDRDQSIVWGSYDRYLTELVLQIERDTDLEAVLIRLRRPVPGRRGARTGSVRKSVV